MLPKRVAAVCADDDMVEQLNIEQGCCSLNSICHSNICLTWLGSTRWVVMGDNYLCSK